MDAGIFVLESVYWNLGGQEPPRHPISYSTPDSSTIIVQEIATIRLAVSLILRV